MGGGLSMSLANAVRLGNFVPRSRANGPGVRAVIWVQGCRRQCPGCCNPEFQNPDGGRVATVDELLARIAAALPLDGLSLSGGEPFDQAAPLAELCRQVRPQGLTIVCFTGYTLSELREADRPDWSSLLSHTDLLVAGPYDQDQPCTEPLRASANQTLHYLTGRITPDDLRGIPRVEVILDDGYLQITGFDPQLSRRLREEFDPGE